MRVEQSQFEQFTPTRRDYFVLRKPLQLGPTPAQSLLNDKFTRNNIDKIWSKHIFLKRRSNKLIKTDKKFTTHSKIRHMKPISLTLTVLTRVHFVHNLQPTTLVLVFLLRIIELKNIMCHLTNVRVGSLI